MDEDGDGLLSLAEWVKNVRTTSRISHDDACACFVLMDTRIDGYITADQFNDYVVGSLVARLESGKLFDELEQLEENPLDSDDDDEEDKAILELLKVCID